MCTKFQVDGLKIQLQQKLPSPNSQKLYPKEGRMKKLTNRAAKKHNALR